MLKFYCKMWARLRLTLITCWLKILHMILFAATMTPFLKKWRKNTWVKSRGYDLFFEATQISKISIWTADRVCWCVCLLHFLIVGAVLMASIDFPCISEMYFELQLFSGNKKGVIWKRWNHKNIHCRITYLQSFGWVLWIYQLHCLTYLQQCGGELGNFNEKFRVLLCF